MSTVSDEANHRISMILLMAKDLRELNARNDDEDIEIILESMRIEIDRSLLAIRLARYLKEA